jgi:hypothetical protein
VFLVGDWMRIDGLMGARGVIKICSTRKVDCFCFLDVDMILPRSRYICTSTENSLVSNSALLIICDCVSDYAMTLCAELCSIVVLQGPARPTEQVLH